MIKKLIINPLYVHLEVAIMCLIKVFHTEGEVIVNGDRNIIKANKLQEEEVSLKFFQKPSFVKSIIYGFFRESKAKRSYEYAVKLLSFNVLSPLPIAWYEEKTKMGLLADSFYICSYIRYDFTFRELIHDPLFPDRENILKQFTRFTFNMHENNVNFLDHSPGNTLIVKSETNPEKYEFYLIDLNRMKFEKLSINQRMDNFKKLWLSKKMVAIISKEYALLSNISEIDLYNELLKSSQGFKKKIVKKKYLKRMYKKRG